MSEWVVFVIFGVLAVSGALGLVFQANPVHSALLLVLTLVSMAVLFIVQGAYFLSVVQIIVYTGAVVVLFLFVIMLLGIDRPDVGEDKLYRQKPVAVGVGLLVFVLTVALAGLGVWKVGAPGRDTAKAIADAGGNVEALSRSLFTRYLLPFELTSFIVVVAVVGGIVLAKRPRKARGVGIGLSKEVATEISREITAQTNGEPGPETPEPEGVPQ